MRSTENVLNDVLYHLVECNNEYKHVVPTKFIDEVKNHISKLSLEGSMDARSGMKERILALDCLNDYMRQRIREIPEEVTTDRITKLEWAMRRAMVGGCSCGTKTPVYEFHKDYCGYKILGEALDGTQPKFVGTFTEEDRIALTKEM